MCDQLCLQIQTMFDHVSKHLKVRQKCSALRRIFNSPLNVLKCDQARSFVFDVIIQSRIELQKMEGIGFQILSLL